MYVALKSLDKDAKVSRVWQSIRYKLKMSDKILDHYKLNAELTWV
jgi:hypothetical protein